MGKTDHTGLAEKRILVTVGTTGIGRATVTMLMEEGARVLTFGRHQQELDDALEKAKGGPGEVSGLTADSSTRDGAREVFAAVDDWLDGLDMLVTCAAIGAGPLHESDEDEWRDVVETNLLGTMGCAWHAIKRMKQADGGHLLFVGSISSTIKAAGESVCSATKAGIDAFAETLRKEISDEKNIKISVIQPGSSAPTCRNARSRSSEKRSPTTRCFMQRRLPRRSCLR